MRWMVEITDLEGDRRFLTDLLKALNVELYQKDGNTYLTSNQFEAKSTSAEVWKLAEEMCEGISELSSGPDTNVSFKLDKLYEHHKNGSQSRYIFGCGKVETLSLLTATATVTSTIEISEEEKNKLRDEQLEREYQEKLTRVTSRLVPALQDKCVLRVHRLLQLELSPKRMYDIFELIQDDFGKQGKKLTLLATKDEQKRFTRSVCHPEVFGEDSRHIVSKVEPPPNPMSLKEARTFILNFADLWFKQKFLDINNV